MQVLFALLGGTGRRRTGSIGYCGLVAPFTAAGGVSFKSFSVNYVVPEGDSIVASGSFSAKQRSVSGSIEPNGWDSTPQTFLLRK